MRPPSPLKAPADAPRSSAVHVAPDASGRDGYDSRAVGEQGEGFGGGYQEEGAQGRRQGEGADPRGRAVQGGQGG